MDFFEHQDQARRSTGRLIVLFVLAVLALIVALNLAVGAALATRGEVHPLVFVAVTAGVIVLVTLGSLYRIASLRGGGRVVAEMLGGRRIDPGQASGKERQLLNVVEEMAIASGAPVPAVYVMDAEPGINAFAAGYRPGDAVVGVTRGTLEQLSREELQGVVAHEFSHILHGDMRLNVRLMGVLYGILLLGLLGQLILRSMRWSGRSRGGGKNSGQALMVILAIGAALLVVGYAGTFFGNLIKAAASRQREFLADASAVQYTRNPGGIGGALMKIGGLKEGSTVVHPSAHEASHFFFGAGVASHLGRLGATHPPLEERVTRILPQLAGRLKKAFKGDRATYAALQGEVAGLSLAAAAAQPGAPSALGQVGNVTGAHLERARELLGALPEELRLAAQGSFSARAVVFALLLDPDDGVRARQLADLGRQADGEVRREFERLAPGVRALAVELRLPLAELCMPALGELSRAQYIDFTRVMSALIRADGQVSFEEFALERLVLQHLGPLHERGFARVNARDARGTLARSAAPAALVLAHLARVGADDEAAAARAFDAAWRHLELGARTLESAPAPNGAGPGAGLGAALDSLRQLQPAHRRRLLEAAAAAITADASVRPAEAELFRLLGEALDVPIPPLLAGQKLA